MFTGPSFDSARAKELWETFYQDNRYTMWYPGEPTIRFLGRLSKERSLKGLRALDFGCGVGRNTLLLSRFGMESHGIDISEEAIALAMGHAQRERKEAIFRVYDGTRIPYPDGHFDIVVSHGVLDHMTLSDAHSAIVEIRRVTKPSGLLEMDVHSTRDAEFGRGRLIEKNTYIIEQAEFEVGLPQHYFEAPELVELLEGFRLLDLYLHEDTRVAQDSFSEGQRSSFWVAVASRL